MADERVRNGDPGKGLRSSVTVEYRVPSGDRLLRIQDSDVYAVLDTFCRLSAKPVAVAEDSAVVVGVCDGF